MFGTYYISSSGQPRAAVQQHDDLSDAINSWKGNRNSLLRLSGGRSVLVDDELTDCGQPAELIWIESVEGGFASGWLSEEASLDCEEQVDMDLAAAAVLRWYFGDE